jgi:hypothetical protein
MRYALRASRQSSSMSSTNLRYPERLLRLGRTSSSISSLIFRQVSILLEWQKERGETPACAVREPETSLLQLSHRACIDS